MVNYYDLTVIFSGINGCQAYYLFAVKAIMKEKPY
jgi:hypothetical protein